LISPFEAGQVDVTVVLGAVVGAIVEEEAVGAGERAQLARQLVARVLVLAVEQVVVDVDDYFGPGRLVARIALIGLFQ